MPGQAQTLLSGSLHRLDQPHSASLAMTTLINLAKTRHPILIGLAEQIG